MKENTRRIAERNQLQRYMKQIGASCSREEDDTDGASPTLSYTLRVGNDSKSIDDPANNKNYERRVCMPKIFTRSAVKIQARFRGVNARRHLSLWNDPRAQATRAWEAMMNSDICLWGQSSDSYLRCLQRENGNTRDPATGQILRTSQQLVRVCKTKSKDSEESRTSPSQANEIQCGEGIEIVQQLLDTTPEEGETVCLRVFGKLAKGVVVSLLVWLQCLVSLSVSSLALPSVMCDKFRRTRNQ